MVSISPFFAGGGGGDIQKLNAGILFQNLRGYIQGGGLLGSLLKKPAFTSADTVTVIIEKSETTPLLPQ